MSQASHGLTRLDEETVDGEFDEKYNRCVDVMDAVASHDYDKASDILNALTDELSEFSDLEKGNGWEMWNEYVDEARALMENDADPSEVIEALDGFTGSIDQISYFHAIESGKI